MKPRTFLTAEWRELAMLNYEVDSTALKRFVPAGTELDSHQGRHFLSIVGFRFLKTKVLGMALPFHRNFEEVNLRFYVRRQTAEGWRRGVVFIKELVPRLAIAVMARTFYGEPYRSLPMHHSISQTNEKISVEYGWRIGGEWESVGVTAAGEARPIKEGSIEEFITEHYWGYTAHNATCTEYQVEHPRWRVWRAHATKLVANISRLYGDSFVECLAQAPKSAFIADGSPVTVRRMSKF